MNRTANQFDRVFLRPQYVVHYRRARRTRWTIQPRADYTALFLLSGQLTCDLGSQSISLAEAEAVLLDPGASASARGRETESLILTLSPSLVLDAATRTRLVGVGSNVLFAEMVVRHSQRLQ
ncbi:MAG TPA: hypothetical protein VGC64_04440, partial [Pyrinomonadaceae bacterium]